MHDLCMFVSFMLSERGHRFDQPIYKLTGSELINARSMVDKANKALGVRIDYQEIDRSKAEEYLRCVLMSDEVERLLLFVIFIHNITLI